MKYWDTEYGCMRPSRGCFQRRLISALYSLLVFLALWEDWLRPPPVSGCYQRGLISALNSLLGLLAQREGWLQSPVCLGLVATKSDFCGVFTVRVFSIVERLIAEPNPLRFRTTQKWLHKCIVQKSLSSSLIDFIQWWRPPWSIHDICRGRRGHCPWSKYFHVEQFFFAWHEIFHQFCTIWRNCL